MSTATIQTFTRFSELPSGLAVKILSYTPVTNLAFVSKTLHSLQEKAMEQEWRAMKSNPLLAGRISTLPQGDFSPICFRLLLDHQRGLAERTPAGFNAFQNLQRLEAGSYGQTRFAQTEPIISVVDREQENNLWKAWIANEGLRDKLAAFLGDAPPQNVAEIRAWMNAPENQAHLNTIRDLFFYDVSLTAFPPEIVKCRFMQRIFAGKNSIRELPDWFAQFTMLKEIYVRENLLERVPEFLLRMPDMNCIGMRANPIRTLPEVYYHHFYTWRMWLGFGFFDSRGSILYISASELREMPFSVYLEKPCWEFTSFVGEKLMDVNKLREEFNNLTSRANLLQMWTSIFGDSRPSRLLGNVLSSILAIACSLVFCISSFLFCSLGLSFIALSWLITRPYLWAIIPIATWVREQMGYGRMIRLN